MVSKVYIKARGSTFDYWKIFTRVDGKNYYHNFRIRDLDTPPLIEALQSLIFLIETVGLPNRLHAKKRANRKGNLPIGVTGPHSSNGATFFRVSCPVNSFQSVERKVFITSDKTREKARKEAINMRRLAIDAYQKANKNDAILVVAKLWQLVEELDEILITSQQEQ